MPDFSPGADITLTASADLIGGQLLEITGPKTVAASSASTPRWKGVARQDAAAGERVVVTSGGVQTLRASGTITAGDRVIPADQGTRRRHRAGAPAHAVGTALPSSPNARPGHHRRGPLRTDRE